MLVNKYASSTSVRYVRLKRDRSFFWGADDSGKNFLESGEEDFRIVDAPEVSSKELNLGVK